MVIKTGTGTGKSENLELSILSTQGDISVKEDNFDVDLLRELRNSTEKKAINLESTDREKLHIDLKTYEKLLDDAFTCLKQIKGKEEQLQDNNLLVKNYSPISQTNIAALKQLSAKNTVTEYLNHYFQLLCKAVNDTYDDLS